MNVDGRAVANFILDVCDEHARPLTNLSLQKISFFCHAWHLVLFDGPLIRHQFEAWEFGPVLQYLYRDFKSFDRRPITSRAQGLNRQSGHHQIISYEFSATVEDMLREVIGFYSRLSAGQLVEISHAEGGPWDKAWNHGGRINPGMIIDNNAIKVFYSRAPAPFSIQ